MSFLKILALNEMHLSTLLLLYNIHVYLCDVTKCQNEKVVKNSET